MAEVADTTGLPSVTPQTEAPNDTSHVQTNPAQFGGLAAQGIEKLAAGGLDAVKFYGQVAADNATNQLQEYNNAILNGDPSKKVQGPDGTMVPDTGFLGKRGADALSAAPDVLAGLDQKTKEIRDNLPTPEAKLQFDQDSRRYRFNWQAQIANHAREQQYTWAKSVNTQTEATALNVIGSAPESDATFAQGNDRLRGAYVRQAHLDGTDPSEALTRADQTAVLTRIRAAIPTNPSLAQRVLDDNTKILAGLPGYDTLTRQVKSGVIESQIGPATDAAISAAKTVAQSSVGLMGQPNGPSTAPLSEAQVGTLIPQLFPGSKITSEQRSPEHNAEVGGVPNSMHIPGQAVDFVPPPGTSLAQVRSALQAKGLPISELIDEKTHIHWGWGTKGAESQPTERYPTVTDALRGNYAQTVQQAQEYAQKAWPQYPDAQERYVSKVQRGLDVAISKQDQEYTIATHTVQQAMGGTLTHGQLPTSEEELNAISPDVASAVQTMKYNNPYGWQTVEKAFDTNAKGKSVTLGVNFKENLDRVLAPANDPNRLTDTSKLWLSSGSGPDAAITNTGIQNIVSLSQLRGTPQGEASATQIRTFADAMYGQMTFTNKRSNIYDHNGETRYSDFMAQALPVLTKAAQSGNLAAVLNPKSPDYIGNLAQHFMRAPAQIMHDRVADHLPPLDYSVMTQHLNSLSSDDLRKQALKDAATNGSISLQDAMRIGIERKWIAGPEKPKDNLPQVPRANFDEN